MLLLESSFQERSPSFPAGGVPGQQWGGRIPGAPDHSLHSWKGCSGNKGPGGGSMRTFHLKEAARKWASSLGSGEEPWGVGRQSCHQQSQQLTAEACSYASQKDSSITFQRWECKLVQPLWKTAWRCRRGMSIPTPFWNGSFDLLSVAFIFIITHNGLPQRALHLCLTIKLKCLCSEPCPPVDGRKEKLTHHCAWGLPF